MSQTNLTTLDNKLKFGGFFTRLFAFILDYLILSIPLHFLMGEKIILFLSDIISNQVSPIISGNNYMFISTIIGIIVSSLSITLIFLLVSFLYNPIFESSKLMATPGKLLFKLEVCDINGERISFLKALNRQMHRFDMLLPLIIGIIASIILAFFELASATVLILPLCAVLSFILTIIHYPMIIVHSKKQSLHDYFAKTYVIQNEQSPIAYWSKIVFVVVLFFLLRELTGDHKEKIKFSYTPSIEKDLSSEKHELEVISRIEEFSPKNHSKENILGNFGEQILPPGQEITYEVKTDKFTKVGFKSLLTDEEKLQIKSTGIRFREINTNSIITADSQIGFFATPVNGKIIFSLTNKESFPFKVNVYNYESQ